MWKEKEEEINSSCSTESIIFFSPWLCPADLLLLLFFKKDNQCASVLVHLLPTGNQAQAVVTVGAKVGSLNLSSGSATSCSSRSSSSNPLPNCYLKMKQVFFSFIQMKSLESRLRVKKLCLRVWKVCQVTGRQATIQSTWYTQTCEHTQGTHFWRTSGVTNICIRRRQTRH